MPDRGRAAATFVLGVVVAVTAPGTGHRNPAAEPDCYGVTIDRQPAYVCEPTPVPPLSPECGSGWIDRISYRICVPS